MDTQAANQPQQGAATASFLGTRWGLLGVLLPGYLWILATLGIYRFWQVTAKRRYYWSHTSIDGDALEYSGTAMQLLVGFLIALAFFLPLYVLFFYLSTQAPEFALLGYAAAAVLIFFLTGYASYRSRRFRLTRTFWRGIRFGQTGNAWGYAARRFFWTIVVVLTAGLAYPFMAASLWRYKFRNTWYGDRQFDFSGSWRTVAAPFYLNYLLMVLMVGGSAYLVAEWGGNDVDTVGGLAVLFAVPVLAIGGLSYLHLKARFASRFLSSVSAGKARVQVRVRARSLLWMYLFYAILFSVVTAGFGFAVSVVFSGLFETMIGQEQLGISDLAALGWVNLATLGLLYLGLLAAYGALAEIILGLGYWRLVARDALIENGDDLKSARASGDESPLAGEGLADALNVGSY